MSTALEIVSIHIPKTAGTSLKHTFDTIYGSNQVVELKRKHVKNHAKQIGQYLQPSTKILHGHFHYTEIDDDILSNEEVKLIVMIRNPIDRVVSNYHHFIQRARRMTLGSIEWFRQFESLMKYASRPETQNVIYKYLSPFDWDRFAYIGTQEDFPKDLENLSRLLGWHTYPAPKLNVHRHKNMLTEKQRNQLQIWNKDDLELYDELVQMKKEKKW